MDRIPYVLSFSALGFLGYFAVHAVDSVGTRLDQMERVAVGENRRADDLREELTRVNEELGQLHGELIESRDELARSEVVASRLESIGREIEVQTERLDRVTEAQDSFDAETIDASLQDLGRELTERWDAVYSVATSAAELAGESRERLDEMNSAPTIIARCGAHCSALSCNSQVRTASGVACSCIGAVRSRMATGNEQVDYVLTAWHVVRDIQGSLYNRDMPIPVAIYVAEGQTRNETAELLEFDADIDIALLLLDATELNEHTVKLPSAGALKHLQIFDSIYAIGCPLGNDPIPTLGQIAAMRHDVDGETYMMINAPTYVGNSGGGIFNAGSHELLASSPRSTRTEPCAPTIVTHMGLVTPMNVVYSWLDEVGYGFLEPSEPGNTTVREASSGDG